MHLLTFTVGLGLFSVVGALFPPLTPARAEEILGKWYIRSWAGTMPIPSWKWSDPLPPFSFEINDLGDLEFRMNLTKPIGCIQFKLPLYDGEVLGMFLTWWRHLIYIHFLPGKKFAIAYFRGRMNFEFYDIMMLMGRTLKPNVESERIFKEFVMSKIPQKGEIINPSHVEPCALVQDA